MRHKKSTVAAVLSTLWMIASAAALTALYISEKYIAFLLAAIQLALPGIIDLILILGGSDIPISDTAPKQPEGGKLPIKILRRILYGLHVFGRSAARFFNRIRTLLAALLIISAAAASQILFWTSFGRMTSVYKLTFIPPVALAVMFVSFIALEKWCAHLSHDSDAYSAAVLGNLRSAFAAGRLSLALCAAAAMLKLLGLYDVQKWLRIALAVIFCYETLFIVISLTVVLIRKELRTAPDLSIPLPFTGGASRDLGLLGYLEKNTGITMRSLWSLRLVKKLIPYTAILAVLLLWVCTGIIQVETYEEGAVYRFGRLQSETLKPGIHLVLPYPFDKVKICSTGTVNRMTVGYISSEDSDNIWTAGHGSSEYKLLLGGGNELVSINLRIEYKVSDLKSYLQCSAEPESILRALAYEAVTARTINTDLDSMLSVDRTAFAGSFADDLSERLENYDLGLEIVSVVLESIHPPVEIASVYQEIVSAGIKAEQYMLEAEAKAAVTRASAEDSRNTAINSANAAKSTAVAAARAEIAGFIASVGADKAYPGSYRYNKYLTAIGKAYGGARLVIVGEGIDSSKIYFGNINLTK